MRANRRNNFGVIGSNTSAFKHSFAARTFKAWNNLPGSICFQNRYRAPLLYPNTHCAIITATLSRDTPRRPLWNVLQDRTRNMVYQLTVLHQPPLYKHVWQDGRHTPACGKMFCRICPEHSYLRSCAFIFQENVQFRDETFRSNAYSVHPLKRTGCIGSNASCLLIEWYAMAQGERQQTKLNNQPSNSCRNANEHFLFRFNKREKLLVAKRTGDTWSQLLWDIII